MSARNWHVKPLNVPPRVDRMIAGGTLTYPKPRWSSERIWRITLAVALLGVMAGSFWGDWV